MKRSLIIIFIILLLAIAFLIMSSNGISYIEPKTITEISPYPKVFERLAKLYYLDNDRLVSETRTISVEMLETEIAAIKALKRGPKINTHFAPIADDVKILSVNTEDRICYVNLSSEFLNHSDERIHLNVMAIVNTIAEFESIDFVQVLTEGKKINAGEYRVGEPLSKNTTLVQEIELQHKDIAVKFLGYISQRRYDLAYDLIDSGSKSYATFRDFKDSAILIRNDLTGYTMSYAFAKREQGRYIITVKYILRDAPSNNELLEDPNTREEYTFTRPMIQEENLWKVQYFDY